MEVCENLFFSLSTSVGFLDLAYKSTGAARPIGTRVVEGQGMPRGGAGIAGRGEEFAGGEASPFPGGAGRASATGNELVSKVATAG